MSGVKNLALAILLTGAVVAPLGYLSTLHLRADNVIRIGHDSKENSPVHNAMLLFKRQVEAASAGELRIEIYPARQLGVVRETTELVRQGNLQMTFGASVLLTSIIPEFNVLDMFYLFTDLAHAHRALDSDTVGGTLLKAMESKGFHGLGFMEVGFRSITSNKRPVTTLADLSGLKIRAASNPTQIAAWEAVGTAPTPLSWGEIFTSLQQGLIDTQESAIYSIYAERFYEAQSYLSLTEHIYTNYVWFANKDFWDSLSRPHQEIINRTAHHVINEQRILAVRQNRDIITELEIKGMRVNVVSDEVRTNIKSRMNDTVYDTLRAKTGEDLFDGILSEIESMKCLPPPDCNG